MQVILLQKVHKLGTLGDVASVKPGFARNYLFPNEMAMMATKDNITDLAQRRAQYEKLAAENLSAAEQRALALQSKRIVIKARANEGKLYGSIGTREIAEAITLQLIPVKKSEVLLTAGVFRETGEYVVGLQLYSDVKPTLTLVIEEE